MIKLDSAIDNLNEKIGFYAAYLILPLIGVVGWEVIMRYGFNAPTSWAFELTVFIYGVHYSLALAYAHKHNTHVAIDVFESRLSEKSRTILRIITNIVLFLPSIGLLTYTPVNWPFSRGSSGNMLQAPGHRLYIHTRP